MVIYRRWEISINITKKSLIYRLEAINCRFFSLICCHNKKSPIFLQFIADFSAIFQQNRLYLCKKKTPSSAQTACPSAQAYPLPRLPFPSQSPAWVGMAISRVFRVTRPAPPRLERVWEHRNRGWDGFRFFKKTRIGFGAGSGLVTICPAPPRMWNYKFTPTYKYLLPILSGLPLPFPLPF